MNRPSAKFKAAKKKRAAQYNATEKDRIVKRRSDKKYYATTNGNLRVRMQRRFKEVMDTASGGRSGKLSEYCSMSTTAEILAWAEQFGTTEENKSKHIDHVIPCSAYAWKWEDGNLIRCDITEDDLKRLWHADNLELVSADANMTKATKIPSDEMLARLKHCLPGYWMGQFPTAHAKNKLAHASKATVRVLEFSDGVRTSVADGTGVTTQNTNSSSPRTACSYPWPQRHREN